MVISNFFIFKNVLALLSISIEIQVSSVSISTDKSARILIEIMLTLWINLERSALSPIFTFQINGRGMSLYLFRLSLLSLSNIL